MKHHRIHNQEIMDSMLNFIRQTDKKLKGQKALRVYVKCLKTGHATIAQAIYKKYGHLFPNDDCITALSITILAAGKNLK